MQKQSKIRIHVQDTRRKTRSAADNSNKEEKQNSFVIVMDNYFTLPRVINALCDKGIKIVVALLNIKELGYQQN